MEQLNLVHNSILAVDDEEQILEIYKTFLGKVTDDVNVASNVEDAIKLLTEKPFDVLLLDINLKQNNGGEVIKFLRESESKNKETPIIVASAYLTPEFIDRNQEKIIFLNKPFSSKELNSALHNALNNNIDDPVKLDAFLKDIIDS